MREVASRSPRRATASVVCCERESLVRFTCTLQNGTGETVPLPSLTPEQRQAALDKAAAARRERAEIKNRIRHSGASPTEVLHEGQTDDEMGRVRGLGTNQIAALEREFGE